MTAPREPSTALFLALVAVTFVGPLSIHLFLPALAPVKLAFGVGDGVAQLTFSLAMLSMAAGTLVYGSLSDRYGRLPVLIGGLTVFTCGAGVAAIAPTIETLIAGRVLQGFGGACGVVIARAVVRDVYGTEKLGQMIAYLTAAYVIGPMLSPPIGGFLTDTYGWQSILILPAVFGGLAIVIAVKVVGETRQPYVGSRPTLARGYWRLITSIRFSLFTLVTAFGSGGFFALNVGASYLMVEAMGRPATEFGLYFMLGPLGYMSGNYLAGVASNRFSGNFLIIFGAILSLVGAVLLPGMIAVFGLVPLSLFIPSLVMSFGQGFMLPHAQAAAISTDAALTGTASGIVVFMQFLFVAVLTQVVAATADGTAMPLTIVLMAAGVLWLACAVAGVVHSKR